MLHQFLIMVVGQKKEEEYEQDLLNDIEHGLKVPVEFILFFFGLMNAGVAFSAIGDATWLVLAVLFIGKPFGIFIPEILGLGTDEMNSIFNDLAASQEPNGVTLILGVIGQGFRVEN